MSYDISVRSKDSHASNQRAEVDSFVASLPGVRPEKPGVFAYTDNRRRVLVHIYTGESDRLDSVELSVAAAFRASSGKEAILLAFRIAHHLGWQVFDPQAGEFLDQSTAAQVLATRNSLPSTDENVSPGYRPTRATFGELFNNHFSDVSRGAILPSIAISALITGYFVVKRNLSLLLLVFLCCCLALVLHACRALLLAVWGKVRDLRA
jgi:hypothetical protein